MARAKSFVHRRRSRSRSGDASRRSAKGDESGEEEEEEEPKGGAIEEARRARARAQYFIPPHQPQSRLYRSATPPAPLGGAAPTAPWGGAAPRLVRSATPPARLSGAAPLVPWGGTLPTKPWGAGAPVEEMGGETSVVRGRGVVLRAKSFMERRPRAMYDGEEEGKEKKGGNGEDKDQEASGGGGGKDKSEEMGDGDDGDEPEDLGCDKVTTGVGPLVLKSRAPLAKAKSFMEQQQPPPPTEVIQLSRPRDLAVGGKQDEEGKDGKEDDEEGSGEERAPRLLTKAASFMKGSARTLGGDGSREERGGGGEAGGASRGPLARNKSFMERLPNPKQVLQGKTT